jgi:hypothetical protein
VTVAAGDLTGHYVVVVARALLSSGFRTSAQTRQGGEELGASGYPASLALLANELDGLAVDIAPTKVDDLRGTEAGEAEADDDFVAQAGFGPVLASGEEAVSFSPGQEAGRVPPLHLAVQPGDLAKRVVPAGQGFN